jgi:hypothetical protein
MPQHRTAGFDRNRGRTECVPQIGGDGRPHALSGMRQGTSLVDEFRLACRRAAVGGADPSAEDRGGLVAFAHDLFRKPVPIPDQVEDMLFGIVR